MVTIRTTDFKAQKATFCLENVMMCSVKSHRNSDFPLYLIGFCNRYSVCILCGRSWIFISNSGSPKSLDGSVHSTVLKGRNTWSKE